MVDITPLVAKGKQIIRGYGSESITIRETQYRDSVIILPDEVIKWDVTSFDDLQVSDFDIIISHAADISVLLLGCGVKHKFLPANIEKSLKSSGIVVETMNTGAACRTYNALLAEERPIAAAILLC